MIKHKVAALWAKYRPFSRTIVLNRLASAIRKLQVAGATNSDIRGPLSKLASFSNEPPELKAIDEKSISPRIAWLPFSFNESIALLGLSRVVNKRLMEDYYRDRLVILTTQEKSASTLHEVTILKMMWHTGGQDVIVPLPRSLKGGPLSMAGQAAFHFGLLLHLPNGGVCRGEFMADPHTIWMTQRHLGCRTIILTRHPADRMVALYCMRHAGLGERMQRYGFEKVDQESILNNLFAGTAFSLSPNIGSLRQNLEWFDGWLEPELRENALIVQYEDMLVDKNAHFERIHNFLYQREMGSELVAELETVFSNSGEGGALQSGDKNTRSYGKGYSGKEGVWREYLTSENVETYNEVVERFLNYSRHADALLALYPNLLLDPNDI